MLRLSRKMIPLLAPLALIAWGGCILAAAPVESRFTNLGPQLSARTFQAAAFTTEPDGRNLACIVVRSYPCAKFLVFDPRSGELRHEFPLPGANGAWAALTAADGSVYVGTEPNGKLFRYLPAEKRVRDLGTALTGETYVWCLARGKDGDVYGGTYPGGRVFRYSPTAGFDESVKGPVVEGESYARSIAFDAASEKLFVGVGVKQPHLIEIDLKTGSRRELLPETFRDQQSVYGLTLSGGYLFAMLMPSHRTLVYEVGTRQVAAELTISGHYELASTPSPVDGRIYYVQAGRLRAFDPRAPKTMPDELLAVASAQATTWMPFEEAADAKPTPWLVLATHQGDLVRYHPETGASVRTPLVSPDEPLVLQSLATGPDGRIWMGSFLGNSTAAFDPESGKTAQFKGVPQTERIEAFDGRLYFGVYPRGRIFEFDPTRPWDPAQRNPQQIATIARQSRPVAMAGASDLRQLFIGLIPEYGALGGALASWDTHNRELTVLGEIVPDHAIASLVYTKGLIVGGTTVHGGLGNEPVAKEGRLFLWDPAAKKIVHDLVPVPGRGIVSGLTVGPDGHVWGFAQGAFFVFDVVARKVVHRDEAYRADFSGRAMWQDASSILHPNGDVFALSDDRLLRIDGRTKAIEVLRRGIQNKHTRPLALDSAGRVYFAHGVELWRYAP